VPYIDQPHLDHRGALRLTERPDLVPGAAEWAIGDSAWSKVRASGRAAVAGGGGEHVVADRCFFFFIHRGHENSVSVTV
jgi:hypothetical protein